MATEKEPASAMLEYAQGYLSKGWCVIPIREGGKTPLVKWQDYQHRKSTKAEVQSWWTKWPNANIGIVTGKVSRLLVVDVDTHHGGEAGPIEAEFPTDMVARTGNGGYHLFYEYPPDHEYIPCQTSISPGLDTRVDGGYVVVSPSTIEGGTPGVYRWLSTSMLGKHIPPFVLQTTSVGGRSVQDGGKASDEWYISAMSNPCAEGARNDTAARLAGSLLRRGHSSEETAAVLKVWNTQNSPPLPPEEIDRVAASVWRTDQTRRSRQSDENSGLDEVSYVDGASLWEQKMPPVDWLVEDWLERDTMGLVVAPPGSFKSFMLLDLCVSLTCDTPFLGLYNVTPDDRPVIYYQQEDPIRTTALRLKRIVGRLDEDQRKSLSKINILSSGRILIGDPAGIDKMAEEIDRIRPSLVCIDPLYASVQSGRAGDEYMRSAADAMLALKKLRDEYHTTFVLAHHTKKSAGEEIQRLDAWGSQFINAALETGWQIRRNDESSAIRVLRHSKQSGDTSPIWLRWEFPPSEFGAPIIQEISQQTITEEVTNRAESSAHAAAHNATNTILAERTKLAFFTILGRELIPFTLHTYHRNRATGEYADDAVLEELKLKAPKKDNVAKKIKTWLAEGLIVATDTENGSQGLLLTEEGKKWVEDKTPKKEEE